MHPAQARNIKNQILIVEQLSAGALFQLFNDTICVLKVPKFCESHLSNKLAEWFEKNERITQYNYVMKSDDAVKTIYYGVDRVGVPFNSTYGDIKRKRKILRRGISWNQGIEISKLSVSFPYRQIAS